MDRTAVFYRGKLARRILGHKATASIFCICGLVTSGVIYEASTPAALVAVLSSFTPLAAYSFFTQPYVTRGFYSVPPSVKSRAQLHERSERLSTDDGVVLETLGLLGRPRRTPVRIGDIQKVHKRRGWANWQVGQKLFLVHTDDHNQMEGRILQRINQLVERRS